MTKNSGDRCQSCDTHCLAIHADGFCRVNYRGTVRVTSTMAASKIEANRPKLPFVSSCFPRHGGDPNFPTGGALTTGKLPLVRTHHRDDTQ